MVVVGQSRAWKSEGAALVGKGYGTSLTARGILDSDDSSGRGGGDVGHAAGAPPRALVRPMSTSQFGREPDGSGSRPRRSVSRQGRPASVRELATPGAVAAKPAAPRSRRSREEGSGPDRARLRRSDSKAGLTPLQLGAPATCSSTEIGSEPALAEISMPAISLSDICVADLHTQVPEAMQPQFDQFSRQLRAHCERLVLEQEQAVAALLVHAAQHPAPSPVNHAPTPMSIFVQPPNAMMDGPTAASGGGFSSTAEQPMGEESKGFLLQPATPKALAMDGSASPASQAKSVQFYITEEATTELKHPHVPCADPHPPSRLHASLTQDLMRRQTLSEKIHRHADSVSLTLGARFLKFCAKLIKWWENLEEPPRSGFFARIVQSYQFSILCTIAIGLNAIFIVYTTDYEMDNIDDPPTPIMVNIEMTFMCFFTVELLLKLIVHRLYLFCGADMLWNMFDMLLVGFSVAESSMVIYVMVSGGGKRNGMNVAYLRSLRIFKLAKVLRVVRSLRFFSELRVMVDCVIGSLVSLFWCLVLLLFILYIFALLLMQGISSAITNGDLKDENREPVREMFGSVGGSMFTLLKITTSGMDWGSVAEVLSDAGTWLVFALTFYILFFCIAAWNVITSTFLERALKLSRPDNDAIMMEEKMKDICDGEALMSLFNEIDADGSESLTLDEFQKVSEHPKFRMFLHARGIDIVDAALFYEMLTAHGNVELDPRTFVNACLRMKGPATSIDLHSLHFETKMLTRTQQHFAKEMLATLAQLHAQIADMSPPRSVAPSARSEAVAPLSPTYVSQQNG